MNDLSDEALLRAFVKGRTEALGELARRYESLLVGLASGILGGRRDLAQDAVQETWVRVIRFGAKFDFRSSVKTWVYRIAINQARNIAARRPFAPLPEQERGIHPEVEVDETPGMIRRAVRGLPEDKRLIVLLCYHEGLTLEQAAEVLDIPVGTIKSRLHATLKELRGALGSTLGPEGVAR